MKKLLLLAFLLAQPLTAHAEKMRMAVTTSFHNSGLSDVLLPAIKEDIGIEVQLLVVGTGQALKLGASGDVDAVLVHAKAAEESFVRGGHGTQRVELMYNDFVILGPLADTAGVAKADSLESALRSIAGSGAPFVSRGDDSGTHKAEMRLWALAEVLPEGEWYLSVGAGMGAALNVAVGQGAYILSDRASWLSFGNKGASGILYQGDPKLFNQYSYIPVADKGRTYIKTDLSEKLRAWLISQRAQSLIDGYRLNGAQLFTWNAR